jgi:hypothetical protein
MSKLDLSNSAKANLITEVNDINEDYLSCIVILSVLLAQKPELEGTVRFLIEDLCPAECDKAWFIVCNAAQAINI